MGRLSDALRKAAELENQPGPVTAAPTAGEVAATSHADEVGGFPPEIQRAPPAEEAPDAWAFDLPSEAPKPPAALAARSAREEAAVFAASSDSVGGGDVAVDGASSLAVEAEEVAKEAREAREARDASLSSLFDRVDLRYARKVVVDDEMMPASREQYRRLAAALHHAQSATELKVVMVASAVPGEGKTLTASNLALTLSESYQRHVLLIDADLRKPSLHTMFRVSGTPGLSDGLNDTAGRKLPLRQISSRLTLLAAGTPTGDPMAGLTSPRMRRIIDEARASFDWVIIDTSPIGLLTDASLLSAMADGALIVVKAGSTPLDLVTRATKAIGPDKIIGVVLNQANVSDQPYGTSYQYGYSAYGGRAGA